MKRLNEFWRIPTLKNSSRVLPPIMHDLHAPFACSRTDCGSLNPHGQRIRKDHQSPLIYHAKFWIEFCRIDTGEVLYALN